MKEDRFSISQFNQQFPDDSACLEYIWQQRFPNGVTCQCGKKDGYYRVERRKCYSCSDCGHQISPCEGTIFHKSSTKLRTWFLAMFYMTASKNGVAAKELERLTGVTYKTAWRMAHQIRKLMVQGGDMLSGVVEADETFIGGKQANMHAEKRKTLKPGTGGINKTAVFGMVERGGNIKAGIVREVSSASLLPKVVQHVEAGSIIHTDEQRAYRVLSRSGFTHSNISHSKGEYVRAEVHTNSIEGFWGQLKRSIHGTFHQVSPTHLQAYVDEFAFRYNHRAAVTEAPIFPRLVERVASPQTTAA